MPSPLELYEEMSLLSSRMAEAARAADWDHLLELERGVKHLRAALLAVPEDADAAPADLARKHTLIQRILEDDAEVRRHTEPWMERIRHFLGGGLSCSPLQQSAAPATGESAAGN